MFAGNTDVVLRSVVTSRSGVRRFSNEQHARTKHAALKVAWTNPNRGVLHMLNLVAFSFATLLSHMAIDSPATSGLRNEKTSKFVHRQPRLADMDHTVAV